MHRQFKDGFSQSKVKETSAYRIEANMRITDPVEDEVVVPEDASYMQVSPRSPNHLISVGSFGSHIKSALSSRRVSNNKGRKNDYTM